MKNPIFDIENWREIGATLARNKTRTFLTAFGIFWGTAMLAMLWGGAGGLKGMLMRNFNGVDTNMGAAFPGRTTMSYKGFNKGMSWRMTQTDIDNIQRIARNIAHSSAVIQTQGFAAYGTETESASITGTSADYYNIQKPVIIAGRTINETDVHYNRKVATIGRNLARTLFGEEDPIGKFVNVNNVYFQIVGVLMQNSEANIGSSLDDSVQLPETTMRTAFNRGDQVDFFVFTAKPGYTPTLIRPDIERAIRLTHPIHPQDELALNLMDVSEIFKMVENLFLGVSLLALVVGAGTLVAGIIGVGNIMWIIVRERTQEIGIRRAIGAKPRDIIVQILSEGVVLTAVAGTAGIVLATLVLYVIDRVSYDPMLGSAHFQLEFAHAITIMTVFLILGTGAGLIPAIKAMRIKPIEAMRDR